MKPLTNIFKLPIINPKLWCLMRLPNSQSSIPNSSQRYKWSVTYVLNIGILMFNNEEFNILLYFRKVKIFKKKSYHKILYLLKNNSKQIHYSKNSQKNHHQLNYNLNLSLLLNPLFQKVQSSRLPKHQINNLATRPVILYQHILASRKLWIDCVLTWSIYLILLVKLIWNLIGKNPLWRKSPLKTVN